MIKYDLPGSVQTPEPDYTGVPVQWRGHVSAVCHTMKDCEDLVYYFGNRPDFCPQQPIILMIPGAMKQVHGMGFATAAELRDCCMEVWSVTLERIAKKGAAMDFDDLRERAGAMRKEDVAVAAQYAFHERVKRQKASPVTNPSKQYRYNRPKNPKQFVQPDNAQWAGKE